MHREVMWNGKVRQACPEDLPFLREMLFEAVFWRPGGQRPSIDEGLAPPELAKILHCWGHSGDKAVLALDDDGSPVAGAWYRYWTPENRSYGFVDASTPELGVAVSQAWRRRGIGTRLIRELMELARGAGARQISLSVEPENPSRLLYEKLGFRRVWEYGGALTMLTSLTEEEFQIMKP